MPSTRSFRILHPGWLLPALVAGLFGVWLVWLRNPGKAPSSDIVVVRAPQTVGDPAVRPPVAPARVAPVAVSADESVAHVARSYPLLSDVAMGCQADRCTLTATIRPLRVQADLDRRQEMLLGGLAAVLFADGYRMAVPFRMDEVDDNLFHIRASATRDAARASDHDVAR